MVKGPSPARIIEMVIVFGIMPLFLLLEVFPKPSFLYLYIASIPVLAWIRASKKLSPSALWNGNRGLNLRTDLIGILSRFGINSVIIVGLMFVLWPGHILKFPADDPLRWCAVLVLYPLVAVYPQELFYRAFFLERYGSLFRSRRLRFVVNGLFFGWSHLLFGNWVAVVLSAVGGVIFADTYERTRSLRLVCFEHALYGNLMFTVGLGEFFYSGWAG
jgi:hypothetical protein